MSKRSLRLLLRTETRLVSEDELARELEAHSQDGFLGVPEGPITIEGIDEQGRLCWRAYYSDWKSLAFDVASERSIREQIASIDDR
jgi:hypothetical protein